eukprot:3561306-Pyramimonas_sp.AAC.1
MVNTFGASLPDGVPSGSQDEEFSCAHPARNGSTCLLKGRAACQFPDAVETPRVILAVRGAWLPRVEADVIHSAFAWQALVGVLDGSTCRGGGCHSCFLWQRPSVDISSSPSRHCG